MRVVWHPKKSFLTLLPIFLTLAVLVLVFSWQKVNQQEIIGGCSCDFARLSGEFDSAETVAYFNNFRLQPPLAALVEAGTTVLGSVFDSDKWVEVDLSEQKLIAWEGQTKYLETLISSGKTGRTPTGEFAIWAKYKYTKMSGGSRENGTYYYLPNVPYTMYFYKGYGLHGTYWHNNFGRPMSHGCVNLPTVAAEKLFYWTTPVLAEGGNFIAASKQNQGTKVVIHD